MTRDEAQAELDDRKAWLAALEQMTQQSPVVKMRAAFLEGFLTEPDEVVIAETADG